MRQELWQSLQVDPERYFPGAQLRQLASLVSQVWQVALQRTQLLALRKDPGLHLMGSQAPNTSWVPTGHVVHKDGPAPEQVAQVAWQERQSGVLRNDPKEQAVHVVADPEHAVQGGLQSTQALLIKVCEPEHVGMIKQEDPSR